MPSPTPLQINPFRQLTAALHMARISLRRLFLSRQTLVCAFLLAMAALAVTAGSMRRERSLEEFVNRITPVYINFLLPAFCLSYATACVAADREEQTLLYSLVTPVPRSLVYLVRWLAALGLSLMWTVGGWALLSRAGGEQPWSGFATLWPIMVWSTLAYVSVFGLFSVLFRRATILALIYVVFLEEIWGSVPGTAKRVAISFYTRCLFIEHGERIGIGPPRYLNLDLLMPISGQAATTTLLVVTLAGLILGAICFARREYA
jgi:hypothetical protein